MLESQVTKIDVYDRFGFSLLIILISVVIVCIWLFVGDVVFMLFESVEPRC